MKLWLVVVLILLAPSFGYSQIQIANMVSVDLSGGLGETIPSPAFRNIFTLGDRIRFEHKLTLSTVNKIESGAGWYVGSNSDLLLFLTRKVFLDAGYDYRYRNGGRWVKTIEWAKLGGGLELPIQNTMVQLRGSFRKQIDYSGAVDNRQIGADFTYRMDLDKWRRWALRMELEPGIIKFDQIRIDRGFTQEGYYFENVRLAREMGFYYFISFGLVNKR